MSLNSVLRRAPLELLQQYGSEPRPTYWVCPRCGAQNPERALRCQNGGAGPTGVCGGLGLQTNSQDGPIVWDLVQAELRRRTEQKLRRRRA